MKHKHKWAKLLAKDGDEIITTSLFTCVECGLLKIGTRTIRISSSRLDMGDLPIKGIKTGSFQGEVNIGDSGTDKTIDWTAGQKQKITTTGSCTLTFDPAPLGPSNLVLRIIHENSASVYTYTWPGTVKWPGGTAPTTTNTAVAVDIISFYYDGTNYHGVDNADFSVPA